jgi:DNA-binding transcriptional MerR regulator
LTLTWREALPSSAMDVSGRQRRVGEVAAATGVTVRTLHHFDEIGLLVPSARSDAGYRLYGAGDLRRLYRILALREVGLPLGEIGAAPEAEGNDPRPALRRHLARLDEELRLAGRLHARLTGILDALDHAGEPSGDEFIQAIEVMTSMSRHYTPEQLDQLRERADALGEAGMRRAQESWAALLAEVERERVAGTDPADPRLDPLLERWAALIEQFTGGDAGIRDSLKRRYDSEGAERASQGAVSDATMAYAGEAMAARRAR